MQVGCLCVVRQLSCIVRDFLFQNASQQNGRFSVSKSILKPQFRATLVDRWVAAKILRGSNIHYKKHSIMRKMQVS